MKVITESWCVHIIILTKSWDCFPEWFHQSALTNTFFLESNLCFFWMFTMLNWTQNSQVLLGLYLNFAYEWQFIHSLNIYRTPTICHVLFLEAGNTDVKKIIFHPHGICVLFIITLNGWDHLGRAYKMRRKENQGQNSEKHQKIKGYREENKS